MLTVSCSLCIRKWVPRLHENGCLLWIAPAAPLIALIAVQTPPILYVIFISATATGYGVPWLRAWLGMFQLLQLIQLPLRASIQGDLDQIEQIHNYETVINVHDVMKQWEWRVLEYIGYCVQGMIAIGCGVFTLIPVSTQRQLVSQSIIIETLIIIVSCLCACAG